MNDENKRPTIKGVKKGIKERFSNIRNKSKVWNLRHKPTEKTAGDGEKITAMESNSYVINKEQGKGFAYFEGLPENAQPVVGFYIKKTQENTEEQQKKGNKWRIIPIVVLLGAGALSMRGCTAEETVVEKKVVPIEVTLHDIENPSTFAWGIEGQAAQEGKFVNEMQGQGSDGAYYDSDVVFENEYKAAKDGEKYEETQKQVKEGLKDLEGKEATTVKLTDVQEKIEDMSETYTEKEAVVDENKDKFIKDVDMYPDSNSEIEKAAAEYISQSFDENQELLEENQKTVEDLIDKAKEGTVNIHEVKEEKDGDITITGEQVVEMVKQEELKGIKAAIRNIQDFFKGLFNQKTEEQR